MLIRITNILAGFILAEPLIGNIATFKKATIRLKTILSPFQVQLGLIELGLGLVTLFTGLTHSSGYYIYGGLPESILAILMGFLLAGEYLKRYIWARRIIAAISPYETYLGLFGMFVGFWVM